MEKLTKKKQDQYLIEEEKSGNTLIKTEALLSSLRKAIYSFSVEVLLPWELKADIVILVQKALNIARISILDAMEFALYQYEGV